jgi:hypothetical protein
MFGFNMNMGSYQATIEIYVGNQLVSSEHMQAPDIVLQMQFMNIAQQLSQDKSQPMSVKMIVPYEFYCEIDNAKKKLNNYVEYSNYEREY